MHILTSCSVILRASVWTWPPCQAWSLPVENRKPLNNWLCNHRLTRWPSQRRSRVENLRMWSAAAGRKTLYHITSLGFVRSCLSAVSANRQHIRVLVRPYSLFDLVGSLVLASRSLWFFVNTHRHDLTGAFLEFITAKDLVIVLRLLHESSYR